MSRKAAVGFIATVVVAGAVGFGIGRESGFRKWHAQFGEPLGVTLEQARKNTGGQYFYKQVKLGPHQYLTVDYPDARGKRCASIMHDPTCPCGRNVR